MIVYIENVFLKTYLQNLNLPEISEFSKVTGQNANIKINFILHTTNKQFEIIF
jgi:hypothetical protein